jgi:hypothetical protein
MISLAQGGFEVKILRVLCLCVLCGILVAGLWPFHAPKNEVTWLRNANGLSFGRYGTVLSAGPLPAPGSQEEPAGSLEIWLRPRLAEDSSTILAFFTPEHAIQFSLHQSEANLAIQKESPNAHIPANGANLVFVHEVFRQRNPVLIAIASGKQGTRVYVNGSLATTAGQFRLSTEDLSGQLVIATSPVVNDPWAGELRGIAIYKQDLTGAQVSRHFETWAARGRPDMGPNDHARALYLFDEHHGHTVHDHSGFGVDLYLPDRYVIVHEKFLESPWQEFHLHWGYWKNVLINVGGFIPLGFFFCAYITLTGGLSRPALTTLVIGASVSLTIEVLQSYLPTRDSGTTDLITNTLGTGLGILLYRWKAALLRQAIYNIRVAVLQ